MNKYRYTDYYGLTQTFDELYQNSKGNKIFNKLIPIITSAENIRLAFRMIKTNTGSNTAGVDGIKIKDIKRTRLVLFFFLKKFI